MIFFIKKRYSYYEINKGILQYIYNCETFKNNQESN